MIDVPKTPAHVGFRYRYYRELEWIHPDETVLATARPLDVRRLGNQADGGVSVDLPNERGVLGTEVQFARETRIDYTGALPEIASSEMTYHFGAEYRARTWLPVRGGVVLIRRDPDRGDGIPPLKGIRMTAGLGYFWHFLDTQVDASYTHEHVRFTPGDPSEELSRSDRASIVFRYLF